MAKENDNGTATMYKKRAQLYKGLVADLHILRTKKSDMLRDLNSEINGKLEALFELADLPLSQTELPLDDEDDTED